MAALLVRDGIEYLVRWNANYVKLTIGSAAETNAFALTTESGLDMLAYPDGRLCIVYQDGSGVPQRKYSRNNGTTWTDS